MMRSRTSSLMLLTAFFVIISNACKHEPLFDNPDPDPDPMDTTKVSCDTSIVYFQQQVLPIFQSNCAQSGCHNAQTAQKGIILDSYQNIMATGDIKKDKPRDSKIMKKGILEDDPDDIMPPPPAQPLTQTQIALILKWIEQGALNNSCIVTGCDTVDIGYVKHIRPIIVLKCQGCHHPANTSGGVNLANYEGVRQVAVDGRLSGAVNHLSGYVPMPQGGAKLPACEITQIEKWVNAGAPNN